MVPSANGIGSAPNHLEDWNRLYSRSTLTRPAEKAAKHNIAIPISAAKG